MDVNAPVQTGVVLPALFRTQWTPPPRPLKDGTDGLLTVRLEVLAHQMALQNCRLCEPLIAIETHNGANRPGVGLRFEERVLGVALRRLLRDCRTFLVPEINLFIEFERQCNERKGSMELGFRKC